MDNSDPPPLWSPLSPAPPPALGCCRITGSALATQRTFDTLRTANVSQTSDMYSAFWVNSRLTIKPLKGARSPNFPFAKLRNFLFKEDGPKVHKILIFFYYIF